METEIGDVMSEDNLCNEMMKVELKIEKVI